MIDPWLPKAMRRSQDIQGSFPQGNDGLGNTIMSNIMPSGGSPTACAAIAESEASAETAAEEPERAKVTIVHEPKEDESEVQWYRDPVVSTADHQLGKSDPPLLHVPCSRSSYGKLGSEHSILS